MASYGHLVLVVYLERCWSTNFNAFSFSPMDANASALAMSTKEGIRVLFDSLHCLARPAKSMVMGAFCSSESGSCSNRSHLKQVKSFWRSSSNMAEQLYQVG